MNDFARLIAFYLPQYHPIPENDAWWGKGFTEWTNVVKARPLFPGHAQPHLPADLGFYDLRSPETRAAQAALARDYGVHGFCYYHYWFNGRRLLERPFHEVLASGQPDFPFCLCWANENWTRAWDGLNQNVLIEHQYHDADDLAHIRWLAQAFRDQRYIRVNGRPLFLIYRISNLPHPARTAEIWRTEAQRLGLGDLYLATVESLRYDRPDPRTLGFDAAVEFQPDWLNLPNPEREVGDGNKIYDYNTLVKKMLQKEAPAYPRFPGLMPGWDNAARRQKDAIIFSNSTPAHYQAWLETVLGKLSNTPHAERLVFINAWNEWGEGAYLEPSQQWGRAYLEATRAALKAYSLTPVNVTSVTALVAQQPVVSVCVPTYNGGQYLRAALQSILEQTFTDYELVLVDDNSTDNTEAIARSFNDPRLRFLRNPQRLGLVGNWNRCLEEARGEFICLFHQDDVMLPDNLAEKVRALQAHPQAGLVYSNVHQIGPANEVYSEWWYYKPEPHEHGVHSGKVYFEKLLTGPNIICCPSVMVRKACYDRLGHFDPRLPFTADWEMWLRLMLFYDVVYLTQPLLHYRRHPAMETLNFQGLENLRQEYLAKWLALTQHPEQTPHYWALRRRVAEDHHHRALQRAFEHSRQSEFDLAQQGWELSAQILKDLGNGALPAAESWSAVIAPPPPDSEPATRLPQRFQPDLRYLVDSMTPLEIADYVPVRKIIKAVAHKAAAKPGLHWLYRFKKLAQKVLL